MKNAAFIIAVTLTALLAPTGCRERGNADPAGIYQLVDIDGKTIPATVSHGAELHVLSGTFIITESNTCESAILLRVPSGEEITKTVKASYTQQDNKLTMKWEGAGITEGTVEGETFTMINEGMAFTYQRQRHTSP